ncbi:RecA-like DNA recombinase [Xanthomonas phage X1]|nr:RecA-like DNA recombinase [Xanthomonas phage X1]
MSLVDKLMKQSTIKETASLENSTFFQKKELVQTKIPVLNLLQSGELDGGFGPGLTIWAGPSKHFKTSFVLTNMKAFLDKYKDGVVLFYDSEFGTPQSYFSSFGIPLDRVVHTPITNIEVLKFDLMQQLDGLNRGDKVFIAIDSVGNLASKKEVEDALEGKSVADMTRAKAFKSLFRMVTPVLSLKGLCMHVVAHTYDTMEMYAKKVVSGGTGLIYSADNIYIVGRQQNKDGQEVVGYNFVLNVEKSRYVREKSKIPVEVTFENGISPWSGLLDLALETGHVVKPSNGWYQQAGTEKKLRLADTNNAAFWVPILTKTDFGAKLKEHFQLAQTEMIKAGTIDYETGEVIEE